MQQKQDTNKLVFLFLESQTLLQESFPKVQVSRQKNSHHAMFYNNLE